jgi:hypothetical protein
MEYDEVADLIIRGVRAVPEAYSIDIYLKEVLHK